MFVDILLFPEKYSIFSSRYCRFRRFILIFRRYIAGSGDIFWFFVDILQISEIYPDFSSIYCRFRRYILVFRRYFADFGDLFWFFVDNTAGSGDLFWFFVDIFQVPEIYPDFSSIYCRFQRFILIFRRYI